MTRLALNYCVDVLDYLGAHWKRYTAVAVLFALSFNEIMRTFLTG